MVLSVMCNLLAPGAAGWGSASEGWLQAQEGQQRLEVGNQVGMNREGRGMCFHRRDG